MCWFFFISLQLVEVNRKPRIKLSEDVEKVTIPGQKIAYRLYGHDGQYLINLNLTLHLHAIFQLKRIGSSQYPRIKSPGSLCPFYVLAKENWKFTVSQNQSPVSPCPFYVLAKENWKFTVSQNQSPVSFAPSMSLLIISMCLYAIIK